MFFNFDRKIGLKRFLDSTETPLIASATYTGPLHFGEDYNYVTGLCLADQDGLLSVEFSPNNVPDIIGATTTEYFANDPLNFKVPITAPYFRIKFTNGTVAQASFKLYWYGAVL